MEARRSGRQWRGAEGCGVTLPLSEYIIQQARSDDLTPRLLVYYGCATYSADTICGLYLAKMSDLRVFRTNRRRDR